MSLKVEEARLRRIAERRGFTLRKSRRRDPAALDYGLYCVSDSHTGNLLSAVDLTGRFIHSLTLDGVREFIQ